MKFDFVQDDGFAFRNAFCQRNIEIKHKLTTAFFEALESLELVRFRRHGDMILYEFFKLKIPLVEDSIEKIRLDLYSN